jgi:regulatory protein
MLTVTRLEPQVKNPQRLNVYLDGEFAFGISRAAAPWLEEGHQLSKQKIEDLQKQDLFEGAYQRALNFLSYRIRSEKEIRQNLHKHQIPEDTIQLVLDHLRNASLVDDHDFAKRWVENRVHFKPRGKRALSSELFQKGISNEVIDEVLEGIDEEKLAIELARSKSRKYAGLNEKDFKSKVTGLLSRRGFPYPITSDVVNTIWLEIENES